MLNLLIFIIDYKKLSNNVSIEKTRMFRCDHKKVVIIMKMRCRKHVRKLIENYINAAETYIILKKILFSKTLILLTMFFINSLTLA